jgi:phospholipid transport system substrate-binding protein
MPAHRPKGQPAGPSATADARFGLGPERLEPAMSLRHPLRLLVLILGLSLAANGIASATAASGPSDFITGLVNAALSALANKQLTQDDRAREFHNLLDKDFDMPRISRFVLGRYWKEASEQERQQFLSLFEEYVVRSYAQRFSDYSGETVKVTGQRPEGETTTLVQSEVIQTNGAPPAKVDWRVRKDDAGFKIVDVDVEGVSMVLTQREQFSSVIERAGGVAGLNRELEQKLASGDASLVPGAAKKE